MSLVRELWWLALELLLVSLEPGQALVRWLVLELLLVLVLWYLVVAGCGNAEVVDTVASAGPTPPALSSRSSRRGSAEPGAAAEPSGIGLSGRDSSSRGGEGPDRSGEEMLDPL